MKNSPVSVAYHLVLAVMVHHHAADCSVGALVVDVCASTCTLVGGDVSEFAGCSPVHVIGGGGGGS